MDSTTHIYRPNGPEAARFCPSCGSSQTDGSRFCPNCGSSLAPSRPSRSVAEAFAVGPAPAAATPRRPSVWLPWIVSVVVLSVGVAMFSVRSSQLEDSRVLAAARAGEIADLRGQLEGANGTISDLESDNSSLRNALEQCRDAAEQGERSVRSLYRTFFVSVYYGPQALRDLRNLRRALAACRVQANSNGIL